MKKKVLIASLSLLLIACSGKTTSSDNAQSSSSSPSSNISLDASSSSSTSNSSSSSTAEETFISFNELPTLLNNLYEKEAYDVVSAKIVNTTVKNTSKTVMSENYEVYNDSSSQSKGSAISYTNEVENKKDTFIRRNKVVTDKIKVDGKVNDYQMLASVLDFKDDIFTNNDYLDSASKIYVVNSSQEATNAGLSDGQYVTKGNLPGSISTNQIPTMYQFLGAQILSNAYAQQLNIKGMQIEKGEDVKYYVEANYSYPDSDLNITTYVTVHVEFHVSNDLSKMLSLNYYAKQTDINNADESDKYESMVSTTVEYSYEGSRVSSPTDALNVDDYFLKTINDIDILQIDSRGDRVVVDPNKISINSSYIFVKAQSYSPEKALDVGLNNVSSSNEKVIKLDSAGYFEVIDLGTTTLKFSYYGLNSENVYEEMFFEKTVTVVPAEPESIRISYNSSISNNSLTLNKTYTLSVVISPIKASQEFTVSSSNESVISASVDDNNNLVLKALSAGNSTITVASKVNPEIKLDVLYYVDGIINVEDIAEKSFFCDRSVYGSTYNLTFHADGTGERIQHYNGKDYRDTFTFTLSDNRIVFSSWNDDAVGIYHYANISKGGTCIDCENEETYATHRYSLEA